MFAQTPTWCPSQFETHDATRREGRTAGEPPSGYPRRVRGARAGREADDRQRSRAQAAILRVRSRSRQFRRRRVRGRTGRTRRVRRDVPEERGLTLRTEHVRTNDSLRGPNEYV